MVQAAYREAEAAREKAAEEARALEDRAEQENPGLYTQDKLWLPHAPGVAIIRGDLLVDVASFFRDSDITVREHNAPNTNRSLQGKGQDIVEAYNDTEIRRFFMRWHAQVRVQIDKFHSPPDTIDLENPGERVLCGMRGERGNAICGLILFLGSTGGPEAGRVDKKCSYWFHSALGFPGKGMWDIGDTPFRMVRVPTKPVPDVYDIMLRFDLTREKERAKHFADNFSENVKEWTVLHTPFEDFYWGTLQNVSAEPNEDDEPQVPSPTDPSEDSDVTNLSDMSGSEDLDGIPMKPRERTACERRLAEAQDQASRERTLAEARAARSREMAEDQGDFERRFAEVRAADLERLTKAIADRERRHAVQAAGQREEHAEAQASREARLAETQADHERTYFEAAEENEGLQNESGGTMAPVEEEVSENEPRRDITRLAPESLRHGGKL
ncbi:hypothetical protein INS49_004619 [Diaporthe citri]|uniref:uncharacterized protein n=1 Tax=Diaporthe citri TaxID=83186 RepID=UPI001C7F734C|nr:uncharacterized protein INS49_004619 [Diaporthe citri]KAG6354601.1 hypothetical protein INS49_004619 [Diaporthe citri]